ncbi:MAG TPA: taurine catabolism dioxygenase TauD, partial [Stellaceae bacterium]|nr:taurine catabolism dioxygenase TauD [Stellaceae bacterium]
MQPQLIEGPAAWRGSELAADPSWRRTLTAEEVAALQRAAAAAEARGIALTGFPAHEFPVPELTPLFAWLAGQLENGPGVARVCGMPVDRLARDQLRRLFWGFCVNLGTPMYQTAAGEILGEV